MAEISVLGSGYVGLVTGACLAHVGHRVTCIDIDERKIDLLRQGKIPIYEPDLDSLVEEGLASERLRFTTDQSESVPQSEFTFIAVQTPSASNGEADLATLLGAARSVAAVVPPGSILIQKSTAPTGTARLIEGIVSHRNGSSVRVVSNPEFLREGSAVYDFLNPQRVVVGSSDPQAAERVAGLYSFSDCPVILTDADSAEMIKYASNAFLAAKISFMNEIAQICNSYGIDVREVARGMGHDARIGPDFLRAGLGWGGSCLPKDVKALIHMSKGANVDPVLLRAVQGVNAHQVKLAVDSLEEQLGDLAGAEVGLLGLSFKPGTDDLRHAPSLHLAEALLKRSAVVRGYDPVAMDGVRRLMPGIQLYDDAYGVARGADALVLVTEWPEFLSLDMTAIKSLMRRPVLFDGRNVWNGEELAKIGFSYAGFGVNSALRSARRDEWFTEPEGSVSWR